MRKALLALLALSGCVGLDAHAPPFARTPYAPFSRTEAVAVALDEWRLWGSRMDVPDDTQDAERQPGLWERVGEYWWEGMNAGEPDARWTGKHDGTGQMFPEAANGDYAWSAAFISYVMRMAGAGRGFPYSPDHATYINYAARAARGEVLHPLLVAENPADYAPRLGDIVCFPRDHAAGMSFADLPSRHGFPAHCAIVVGGGVGMVKVVGGNVNDAVEMDVLHAGHAGMLNGNPDNWFVVLKVNYAVN